MTNNFLTREVKQDGRGVYIHYGGCRLRPSKPDETRFRLNQIVNITYQNKSGAPIDRARVFDNRNNNYELWRRR